MPRFVWSGFALAVLVFAAALGGGSVDAQPAPAVSSSPAAASPAPSPSATPSPAPSPFRLLTANGFIDTGFESVAGTNAVRFTNGVPSRIFDAATGPFFDSNGGRQLAGPNDFNATPDLQNANLQLTFNGPVGGKLEGTFGTDADVMASNGQSRSGVNLTQAYLQAVRGPFTLLVGKFETLAGEEVIETTGDSNYTRSYLFGEAIPFTHTGVRLVYAPSGKLSLDLGANDGWDDWKFAGKKKTLEFGLGINPSPGYGLSIVTYNGNDFALSGNSALSQPAVFTNRMLYDGVLTVHATGALTLNAEYDIGTQLADASGLFPTAHWNGVGGYLAYTASPFYGIALRKETFHDDQGFRTGLAQRLQSTTATINLHLRGLNTLRLEYRLDASDQPDFIYTGAPAGVGRQHQSSIGLEAIFTYP